MELMQAVQDNAGVGAERAEAAVGAVLRLMGERVSGGIADEMAEQLPGPAARALRMRTGDMAGVGDSSTLARSVADELGVDETEALNLVQGVFRGLDAIVEPDTLARLRQQLPLDLANLFSHR